MVNMVAAGEASGSLETALDRMATQFEKTAKTRALVKKAMIYPVVVMCVALVVVIVMLVVVIPRYTEMFKELGTDLPAITRGVQAASDFLISYWFIVFPIIILSIVALVGWSKTDSGKHVFHKIKLPPRGKGCAVCSDTPTITELIDYAQSVCDLKNH